MARVVLTRPAQQAGPWLAGLSEVGHTVNSFPLIEISPCRGEADQMPFEQSWAEMSHWSAIMFVSYSSTQAFFDENRRSALAKTAQNAIEYIADVNPNLRFWVTGPGTLASLRALGISRDRIDAPDSSEAQFDSEALWRRVATQMAPGKRVLIVRGRDVGSPDSSRDWLAQQISAQGASAHSIVVYERRSPTWSPAQLLQCQNWLRDGSIWVLSSSQALNNLPHNLDTHAARCICTHARISENAKARGFAVVCTSRPTLQEVASSIKSMHE